MRNSDAIGRTPVCPKCGKNIPRENINVARDTAYCRECNLICALSDLTEHEDKSIKEGIFSLNEPIKGAWFRRDMFGVSMGASCRSLSTVAGVLFFALFWNGLVSIFVVDNIAQTLRCAGIPIPEWFPNMPSSKEGLGMVLFLWLFLTPFIVVGMGMLGAAGTALFGKYEITLSADRDIGKIFVGVGRIGWTRKFVPSQINVVHIVDEGRPGARGWRQEKIFLWTKTGETIKFGTILTAKRRAFLLYALERSLPTL
jgi:hypothetical protein